MCYALIISSAVIFAHDPLQLPFEFTLAVWAFLGFGVLLYKTIRKKIEKSLSVFCWVFLCFGLVFTLEGLMRIDQKLALAPIAWIAPYFREEPQNQKPEKVVHQKRTLQERL